MLQLLHAGEETSTIHIVGQGLAGSTLALSLIEQGYTVRVYDNGYRTSSSMIAAGMWNPLSYVNLKRSWLANDFLPELEKTYTRFELLLKKSFFHPQRLVRIFPDAGAANLWEERSDHPEVSTYIGKESVLDSETHFNQPFGHGVILKAGWLDLPLFLASSCALFKDMGVHQIKEVDTTQMLQWLNDGDWVIQCTGWKPMADNLWNTVPIHTSKGQVFTLRIEGLSEDYMSNFGKFAIPLGDSLFRVGSTYEHGALDPLPSEVANEVLDDVRKSVRKSFEIIDLKSGFRPTTIDRQPVVGMHNHHSRLGIFNGFGSRGVMMVPFFARHLMQHLTEGAPIMKGVDWRRFEERRQRSQ